MQPLIMVTNGGDHPADKWADVTATNIANLVQVDEDTPADSDADRARKAAARPYGSGHPSRRRPARDLDRQNRHRARPGRHAVPAQRQAMRDQEATMRGSIDATIAADDAATSGT
jgi:hypothetical protein